jgi:hypothetical protein
MNNDTWTYNFAKNGEQTTIYCWLIAKKITSK